MSVATPIPAFNDNYLWLLTQPGDDRAAIVDPGDAGPVLQTLAEKNLRLCAILITHHHNDHIGGVRKLLAAYPGIPVYGPANEDIPTLTQLLREGDCVTLPNGLSFSVLDVPGHTAGHIAYYGDGKLFCGDTVFACGCGRLFEGTPQQMHASLSKIAALPGETLMYCAHEYTLDNIAFAQWVEPNNADLLQRAQDAKALRAQGVPTVPSRLELEKRTNPFLRFDEPTVIAAAEWEVGRKLGGGAEVFWAVRRWKDTKFD